MKSYYIYQGDKQHGPYTIHQLSAMQINPAVPVWTEGFTQWIKAREVPELQPIFSLAPPPFNTTSSASNGYVTLHSTTEHVGFIIGKKWKIFLLIAAVALTIFLVARAQQPRSERGSFDAAFSKSPEQLRAELKQYEMMKPTHYLKGKLGHRKNVIGETVLEGTVENRATIANFKDVVLKITWLSKTNSEMSVTRHTIYEYIGADQTVAFKLKTLGPSGYTNMNVEIESATTE